MDNIEYAQGFDCGCNFILMEIENYMREHGVDYSELINHLKGDKDDAKTGN